MRYVARMAGPRPASVRFPTCGKHGTCGGAGHDVGQDCGPKRAWFKKAAFWVTLDMRVLRPSLRGSLMRGGAWTGRAPVSSGGTSRNPVA